MNKSITLWQVKEARRRVREGGSTKLVARRFGVSRATVYNAVTGQTWSSIRNPPPLERGEIREIATKIARQNKRCANCGRRFSNGGTRCGRCAGYFYRNGRERPKRIDHRRVAKLSNDELTELYQRYEAGESLRSIAKDLPFSDVTLSSRFKAAGLEIRRNGGVGRLTEQSVIRVRALVYSDGMKISEVAKLLSVNYQTLNSAVNGHSWKHVSGLPAEKRPWKCRRLTCSPSRKRKASKANGHAQTAAQHFGPTASISGVIDW